MPIRPMLWENPWGLPETEWAKVLQIVNNAQEKLAGQMLLEGMLYGTAAWKVTPDGVEYLTPAALYGRGR
jgi:hypothetical protein